MNYPVIAHTRAVLIQIKAATVPRSPSFIGVSVVLIIRSVIFDRPILLLDGSSLAQALKVRSFSRVPALHIRGPVHAPEAAMMVGRGQR